MLIDFLDWKCEVILDKYENGRTCIKLKHPATGGNVATATINLPDIQQHEDEVFIKDYSENAGMLAALINAKVVAPPHEIIPTGYVSVAACKLLIPI
jgi:hypothetical protein